MRLHRTEAGNNPFRADAARSDLICFSHLRWDFVFQRPQHLLSRAARTMRVLFWEEPLHTTSEYANVDRRVSPEGVIILQPRIPHGRDWATAQRHLLDQVMREFGVHDPLLWYYTPHALHFSGHLNGTTVYDCMDELAAFAGADPALPELERRLMRKANLVFAGGRSLYEVKHGQHADVHAFPSGVDVGHFLPARGALPDPPDQQVIPHPRVGFYGVLDERLDGNLLAAVADLRPDTHFVLIGPTAKIDLEELPRRANLHYLGSKRYADLPAYVGNWDAAMMPFALNEATRFISPTKTPEYLAAGRPVVSTPVVDVVRQYGATSGVWVAGTAAEFAAAIDAALAQAAGPTHWLAPVDQALSEMSWDVIWSCMSLLIEEHRQTPGASPLRKPMAKYDVLIVGAGFAGSVLAERMAAGSGKRVLLVDRRPHIGGNAYDQHDLAGVLIHPYGPHMLHTDSQAILEYLSRFTEWRPYEHRVLAEGCGMRLPMPINRQTVNQFFGVDLSQDEVEAFLESKAEQMGTVRAYTDVVFGKVGRELYEAFFQGYTRKQWGLDPSELDKSVTSRVPTRIDDDDRHFTDQFQQMPLHGYTRMFECMLDHPGITVALDTDFGDVDPACYDQLIFTGPINEFFDHRYGKLPYRSLQFRHEIHDEAWLQPVGVVNYPTEAVPYTRITEFKHLTGQTHAKTSLCYEYPSAEGDPYYPVPRPENAALFQKYQALADATPNVTFVGRLASYKYYNMDQVVGRALATYQRLTARERLLQEAEASPAAAAE